MKKIKKIKEKREKLVKGVLSKHRRGFGFVIPENKGENQGGDIFISPSDMLGAMNEDTVEVRIMNHSRGDSAREGMIEKIVKRANKEIVGTLTVRGDHGYIVPAAGKGAEAVFVPARYFNGALSGDRVAADIIRWPAKDRPAEAKIKEIISKKGEAGGDVKALIRAFQVRDVFSGKINNEVSDLPRQIEKSDLIGRRDLRDKQIITIDGADAKDLDDAVSVERLDNGNYLLGVHIADVSHYVKEGKPLDREALKRGTSIYLIDWVVPMLPPELSNGICSLFSGEDRLTLSVSMEIDGTGLVVSHDIYKSFIRSNERMVYTDVSDILEKGDQLLTDKYSHIYPTLLLMEELASVLRNNRKQKGSLDFDIGESFITLNDKGEPVIVEEAERRIGNRIIEEFMLAANETIAGHFHHLELPFIYRIHEKPAPDKIAEFKNFLTSIGLSVKGNPDDIHPKALNDVLNEVRGTNKEGLVNTVMLRSMKKAYYGIDCLGHFGLGMKYYCHFTSPIRRYPDLFIHRVIKEFIDGGIYGERINALKQKGIEAADNSSLMERKAEELEREVDRLKKAEYMSSRIGEEYGGIISGINSSGFFVELGNTVEGMVRVDTINDDYYNYEPEAYRFIGSNNRKIYGLGDSVNIIVDSVDMEAKEIRFVISDRDSKTTE